MCWWCMAESCCDGKVLCGARVGVDAEHQGHILTSKSNRRFLSGRFRDSYALGIGGTVGVLVTPLPEWKLQLTARQLWYELGDPHRGLEVTIKQNLHIDENLSLVFELGRERIFGRYATDGAMLVNYYW